MGFSFLFALDNRADQDRDWTGRELGGGTPHFGTTIEYGQGGLLVPLSPLFFFHHLVGGRRVACSTRCREYRRRVCRLNLFLSLSLFADAPSCVGAALALACTVSLSLD